MSREPPHNPLVPLTREAQARWVKLYDEAAAQLANAYLRVALEFGRQEANRQVKALTTKRRGKPKGSTKPAQDKELLKRYDIMARNPEFRDKTKILPKRIGDDLHATAKGEYGSTAAAIAARLRRLLQQRKERRLKLQEEAATRPLTGNKLLDAGGRRNK